MTLADLLDSALVQPGFDAIEVTDITLDSRKAGPGCVFAALPGVKVHGRQFAASAVERGAVAVISDAPIDGVEVPVIAVDDPAALFSFMAAKVFPGQPEHVVAVTGTNGKSSTVEFLRQIWVKAGIDGASLGTLGVTRGHEREVTGYTTPDAAALQKALSALAGEGVTHLAMEASSHGLKQRRMEAVNLKIAGFSNLTQDHLDYHPDFEDYFRSKQRLFTERLPVNGTAVINIDGEWGVKIAQSTRARGVKTLTIGWRGEDLQLLEVVPRPASQSVAFNWAGETIRMDMPLVGEFQVLNAILAAAIAFEEGLDRDLVVAALESLEGVAGRLEKVGETTDAAPVLVDYAHTPDGLDKLIRAARPHTRGRILVVFGCGGDRDPDKRSKMGAIAEQLADLVIVTDDNPRSEDPADIRRAVMAGCPGATEIADREEAIFHAVSQLREGDCLLIAGKGHETGQTVGDVVHPFDDREVGARALKAREASHV